MGEEAAPSERKNIYKVLRLHGVSDMELDEFIETMMSELQLLASYRGLAEVATHLDIAIKASQKARLGGIPLLLGVGRKRVSQKSKPSSSSGSLEGLSWAATLVSRAGDADRSRSR